MYHSTNSLTCRLVFTRLKLGEPIIAESQKKNQNLLVPCQRELTLFVPIRVVDEGMEGNSIATERSIHGMPLVTGLRRRTKQVVIKPAPILAILIITILRKIVVIERFQTELSWQSWGSRKANSAIIDVR